jgi:ComF family protein
MTLRWTSFTAFRRWPAPCLVCRGWCLGGLCEPCVARFASPRPRCPLCGLARPAQAHAGDCPDCRRHPPPVDGLITTLDYGFPWMDLLHRFKFSAQAELARPLAQPLIQAVQSHPASAEVDWIIPIPLAPARLAERGYNQSQLLAQHLAHAVGKPCRADLLRRWKGTATQSMLAHADARQANLRGAFMPDPAHQAQLRGRRVALVDDVMTTGTTLWEAARCLRQAGVEQVWCWVLARTPAPGSDNRPHVPYRFGPP